MRDNLPEEVLKEMKNTVKQYRPEKQRKDIEKVYVNTLFANRVKELQTVLDYLNKNNTELNSEN
jgi:ABC-type phosphate/phosphonate transport system substrate-binding protein